MDINIDELNKKIEENIKLQEQMKKQLSEMEEMKKTLLSSELDTLKNRKRILLDEKSNLKNTLNHLTKEKNAIEEKIVNENKKYNEVVMELNSIEDKILNYSKSVDGEIKKTNEGHKEFQNQKEDVKKAIDDNSENEKVTTQFEEALQSVKNKDKTCVQYMDMYKNLEKYDKELYVIVNHIEKSAEYSFNETFTKLGNFLDVFTDKILNKNGINKASVIQNRTTLLDQLTSKINYLISKQIVNLPNNVSYKCEASEDYINTNCFSFLIMLYKTAVLPKEQLRNSYPIYNDEVMTKCLKSIRYLLNYWLN